MKFLSGKTFNSPYFGALFVFVAMALYFGISYICRATIGIFDIEEVGVTETFTYLFYGFGGGVLFCCAKYFMSDSSKARSFGAVVFIYLMMILRDMGAQAWLTTHDTVITKIRFFTSPNNPLYEKIIGGGVMLFILAVFLYVLIKHIKPLVKGFVKFEPIPWTLAFFFVWMFITQVADRLPAEYMKATGVALTEPVRFALKILEEGGESLLPLLIVIALLQFCAMYCCNKEN